MRMTLAIDILIIWILFSVDVTFAETNILDIELYSVLCVVPVLDRKRIKPRIVVDKIQRKIVLSQYWGFVHGRNTERCCT